VEEEEEEDNAEGLIRIHGRAAGPGDEIQGSQARSRVTSIR
jgi:hypothetical protein